MKEIEDRKILRWIATGSCINKFITKVHANVTEETILDFKSSSFKRIKNNATLALVTL